MKAFAVFLKANIYQQIICANNLRSYKFLLQGNSPRCGGDGGFDSANGYVIVRRRIRDYRFPRLVRLSLTGGRDVFLDEHVEDLCSDRADGKLQPRALLRQELDRPGVSGAHVASGRIESLEGILNP